MKEELLTDAVLREFLLGKVDDEERARIESLFLTDPEAREKILVNEQELIEDYLEDSLNAGDREKFLQRYGQTPAQLQQLRISKAIKEWAIRENASLAVSGGTSIFQRLRAGLLTRPVFVVPIAVAAIIAVVFVCVWLNGRLKHSAIQRELAQLNTPASLREVPPQLVSMDLRAIAVRSFEGVSEFKQSADVQKLELRLPWIQKERYPTYQAEIRRVSDDESFIIPNLQAENDTLPIIRIRLPTDILNRGQYQVRLSGIDGGGAMGITEEYAFMVDG